MPTMPLLLTIRRSWEKNAPEWLAAVSGRMPSFVLARAPRELGGQVPVFCYHSAVHAALDADLRFLADNGYVTLDADALCDHLDGVRPAPPRSVVLTFDDGSTTLHDVALPLLRAYRQRAVAFVAPRFHEHEHHDATGGQRPCTRGQLRALHDSGCFDVQSHTVTHRYLPRYPEPMPMVDADPAWQAQTRGEPIGVERELAESKATLEAWLGKSVTHIAFPAYRGSDDVIALGRRLGYRGFYWGVMPPRPRDGSPTTHIARLSGEFTRRLPGRGRVTLSSILRHRWL
jgi:peptidoglycan/xylan/chitin deacetylase (PgdA/CDA1 family)